jgi:hypothetical protein
VLLYHPLMMMNEECVAIGGMIIRGNLSTWKKHAPVPFCLSQIPLSLTWARTRAAALGSWRLTDLATARFYHED